jgi:hypothetical protein
VVGESSLFVHRASRCCRVEVEATNALITSYPQTRIQETSADSSPTEARSNVDVDDVSLVEPKVFRKRRYIVYDHGSETDLTLAILDQPGEGAPIRQRPLEELSAFAR